MIRFFAGHPTAANLLMIGLMAIGLIAATAVKRETFPEIPARQVEVRVALPAASAERVEEAVCQRLEDAVEGITGLDETRCEAREGLALAVLELEEGGDVARFVDDVKTEVDAIDDFPADHERPVVRELGRTDFLASVAVAGPMAPPDLKAYAERVKDDLLTLPGIAEISIQGFSDHQIRIEARADALRRFGLTIDDLADAVGRQSVDQPAGTIETRDGNLLVRLDQESRTPVQFEDLVVITAASGAEVPLGEVATIRDQFERAEDKVYFNGRRAAYLIVNKGSDDDTLTSIDAVQAYIERHLATAPPGVVLAVTQDVSSIVRDRLTMLLDNGIQGLILVFLTMWLFFSLRYSFWVAAGLPVSFLGTVAGMAAIGMSFDMMTMVGLLIAIGLLMDDAIVLAENIARHAAEGAPPLRAVVDGAGEVAPGVMSSFLTTVCVFGSLAFLGGDIGAVLRVMPIVLIMTLAVSLIEAFLILPHHLKGALGRERPPGAFRRRFEAVLDTIRERGLGRIVDAAVTWRYLTIGIVTGTFLGALALIAGGIVKFQVFPELEGNVIEARLLLSQGTPLARTETVVDRLTGALDTIDHEFAPRQPDGRALIRNVGIRYNHNADAHETGSHMATVTVDLLDAEVRDAPLDAVLDRWRTIVGSPPDVMWIKYGQSQLGPGGRDIDIRLGGDDLDRLKAASRELTAWIGAYEGVNDLSDDLRPGKPELRIRLRDGAAALGLRGADLAGQLRTAFQGRTVSEIQVGGEAYEVDVRLAPEDRDSLADLDDLPVATPGGALVPLDTVAAAELSRGFARINRIDGRRTVTIQGDVDGRIANAAEIVSDTADRFVPGLLQRFPGVTVDLEGQAEETAVTGSSLRNNFLLGMIGIFLVLSFQFRSYVEPIVVMAVIPLALIGVVAGHLLMGLDLSMPSMVGAASLAGIVVNDSILVVAFTKSHRRRGETAGDAARMAARQRFRAILLTSLTTVAGLLPLLTETSLQAQVLIPLVTSLVFGMLAATLLVLIVVPTLYAILDDFGLTEDVGAAANAEPAAGTNPA